MEMQEGMQRRCKRNANRKQCRLHKPSSNVTWGSVGAACFFSSECLLSISQQSLLLETTPTHFSAAMPCSCSALLQQHHQCKHQPESGRDEPHRFGCGDRQARQLLSQWPTDQTTSLLFIKLSTGWASMELIDSNSLSHHHQPVYLDKHLWPSNALQCIASLEVDGLRIG